MPRLVLTDDQRIDILNALESESTAALARRIGAPYSTTYAVRSQMRAHGWYCALSIGICDTCGQTLLIPPQSHGMRRHRQCKPESNRRRQLLERQQNEAFRATVHDRARDRQNTLKLATEGLDTASRQRWTAEDDAYLLEHRADVYTVDGIATLARTLGRSYSALQTRLTRLESRYGPRWQ